MGNEGFGYGWVDEPKGRDKQSTSIPTQGIRDFGDYLSGVFSGDKKGEQAKDFQSYCSRERKDLEQAYSLFAEQIKKSTRGNLDRMIEGFSQRTHELLTKSGKTVSEFKHALNDHLSLCLETNDQLDTDTFKALIAFQKKSNLFMTGVCDTSTQKKLFGPSQRQSMTASTREHLDVSDVPKGWERRNIRFLEKHHLTIADMQKQLNDELGLNLPINNDFDDLTYSALKKFQSKHKLTVDGLCGPKTIKVLFEDSLPATVRRTVGKLRAGAERISSSIRSVPTYYSKKGTPQCSKSARLNLTKLGVPAPPQGTSAKESFHQYPSSKVQSMSQLPQSDARVADVFLDATPKNREYGHRAAAFNRGGNWYVLDPFYGKKIAGGGDGRQPIPLESYVNYHERNNRKFWGAALYS